MHISLKRRIECLRTLMHPQSKHLSSFVQTFRCNHHYSLQETIFLFRKMHVDFKLIIKHLKVPGVGSPCTSSTKKTPQGRTSTMKAILLLSVAATLTIISSPSSASSECSSSSTSSSLGPWLSPAAELVRASSEKEDGCCPKVKKTCREKHHHKFGKNWSILIVFVWNCPMLRHEPSKKSYH